MPALQNRTTEYEALQSRFEPIAGATERSSEALAVLRDIRAALEAGRIRVAECTNGRWVVHSWIKQALTLHAQLGVVGLQSDNGGLALTTRPEREGTVQIAKTPPESMIHEGAFLGEGVICMPSSVIQIGAYLGPGCLIDAHALIGPGVQLGQNVIVECGALLGGQLLPIDALPLIIEDDVVIGGGSGIYGNFHIGRGVILTASTTLKPFVRIWDARTGDWLDQMPGRPVYIPDNSVLSMGIVGIQGPAQIIAPLIIGTRDPETPHEIQWVEDCTAPSICLSHPRI